MTSTNLVKYTGQSFPDIGIFNGMPLDAVILAIANASIDIKKRTVSIDGNDLSLEDSITRLSSAVNGFNSDNIKINGNIGGVSSAAAYFSNKVSKYDISLVGINLIYAFDLNDILRGLPSDYNLIYVKTVASQLQSSSRMTLIQDNDKVAGNISIPFDKLPATINTTLRFNTPSGDITLSASHPVMSAVKGSGNIVFDIKDYTNDRSGSLSVSEWGTSISNELNKLKGEREQLNQYKISGFDNVPDQEGLFSCVSSIYSICDKIIGDVTGLSTISMPKTGTCVGTSTGTPQQAFDALSTENLRLNQELTDVKNLITEQSKQISSLSGFYSSIVNSNSGSTLTQQQTSTAPDGTITITSTGSGGCGRGGTCP